MRKYVQLLIIFISIAHCDLYMIPNNVGTVLFSSEDINRDHWNSSELAILEARRYFQNLIPPPHLTYTLDDEYLVHLLNYFENCFKYVGKEAKTSTEQDCMNIALFDAIGGYIKVWVLPITKYAYYGGTISSDNAIKVFQMYGNIKRSLKTDGRSWREPNEDTLRAVSIDIAPNPHEWSVRSAHGGCDRLAYYEKSDRGLLIPLPYINWSLSPQTMFVPLKNQSLIQLVSTNSSTALIDYYTVAASCLNSQSYDNHDDFGSRFQMWLTSDVVPHLKDDNLYIAFGSVLALLNKTKTFYKDVVNFCDDKYVSLHNKVVAAGCPISWASKKVFVIAILIIIEIIWCIPAICCVWSHKRKKTKKLCQFFRKKPKQNPLLFPSNKDHLFPGVKLFLKPKARNLEVDVEFPSYGPKYVTVKSIKSSTNVSKARLTHINEITKQCYGNERYNDINPSLEESLGLPNSHICDQEPTKSILKSSKYSKSAPQLPDLHSTKTMSVLQEHEIKNISYTHACVSMSKSVCKCISLKNEDNNRKPLHNSGTQSITQISQNKMIGKNDSSNISKELCTTKQLQHLSRSELKSSSRNLRKESNAIKLSEISEHSRDKDDQPQITTEKHSYIVTPSQSYKNRHTTGRQSQNMTNIATVKPKKASKLKRHDKPSKMNAESSKKSEGNRIDSEKKSRVPRILQTTKTNQTNEKPNSKGHATLNIKIYNTQTDLSKISDNTKTSKEREEHDEKKGKEYHTLNIDIDHPRTDIEVDITSYKSSKLRPSKIPRRIIFKTDNSLNSSNRSATPTDNILPGTIKTMSRKIKTTLDDSNIPRTREENTKLNTSI